MLIRKTINQIILMLASINIKLNLEIHYDVRKIKDGLILWILIFGFNGVLDTG